VEATRLAGIERHIWPFGRSDAFWDKSTSYFSDSDFYKGMVLGIQADSTNVNSSCATSYNTMVTTVLNLVKYSVSDFKSNFENAGVSVLSDYGYYAAIIKKYQDASLTAFDFYGYFTFFLIISE
jgi:hypothetical protein